MNARFRVGESVRVRLAFPPGHVRTPHYCRGKPGVIVEFLGAAGNPEALAYRHANAAQVPLYRVRFRHADLWPERSASRDETEIEILEHWLEPGTGVSE